MVSHRVSEPAVVELAIDVRIEIPVEPQMRDPPEDRHACRTRSTPSFLPGNVSGDRLRLLGRTPPGGMDCRQVGELLQHYLVPFVVSSIGYLAPFRCRDADAQLDL